jgi:3-oxoacyl-[acyl-carrier protein] reductase
LRVAEVLHGLGAVSIAVVADALDPKALPAAFQEASQGVGGVDLLVNIIGMPTTALSSEVDPETWDRDFNRNLDYVLRSAQCLLKDVRNRDASGAMVSISSIAGLSGSAMRASYGAAKAGLINLTMSLAEEWAPTVRLNTIAPGAILTVRTADREQSILDGFVERIPMGRMGTTDEIARVAVFLLSDWASYITGQTIVVDGGVMAASRFPWP